VTAVGAVRGTVSVVVAAAVLAAGVLLLHAGTWLAEAVQVWRGYYTVTVASTAPGLPKLPEVPARLAAAGLGPVVAPATAPELITTFRGYEQVVVADLDRRLDRLDPRYDPYLLAVPNWFAAGGDGGQARIVYVASTLPPAAFAVRAAGALAGTGLQWQIAGLPWRSLAAALLCFLVAASALILPRGGAVPRRWRALLALPWLFLVAHGGLPAAFVAVPAHVAAVRVAGAVARRGRLARGREPGSERAAPFARGVLGVGLLAGAGAAAAVLATLTGAGEQVAAMARYLAIGSLWSGALAVSAILAGVLVRYPRPDATGSALPAGRAPLSARLGGAAVLAALAAALVLPFTTGAHVPRPGLAAARAPVTLSALAAQVGAGTASGLPGLGDYVTHLAYQQTLALGRPYRLPTPGERVTVDHYRRGEDGRVLREPREVARFTEQWLADALAEVPAGSVAALLAAQGSPTAVHRGPPPPRSAAEIVLWIAVAAALGLWIIDPARRA
jgi:hypothetical protein